MKDLLKFMNLEPGLYRTSSYVPTPVPDTSYIDFTIDNTGKTSLDLKIDLVKTSAESSTSIWDLFTGTMLVFDSSINQTINTSDHPNTFTIRVAGDILDCEYTVPGLIGIDVNKVTNLRLISEPARVGMPQHKSISFFHLIGENQITNLINCFVGCTKLTDVSMNTPHVNTMESMFMGCTSLTTIPFLDTSNVNTMRAMFIGCINLNSIPQLDTSNVVFMDKMFQDCSSLTRIPLLDTSSVIDVSNMFNGCSKLTTIPLLNTLKVTNMSSTFMNCTLLNSVPKLDTTLVTDMSNMFNGCRNLSIIPELNTPSVTNLGSTFGYCISIIDCPQVNTSKVTDFSNMFRGCSSLRSVSGLDTSKGILMNGMLSLCSSLTTITQMDVSSSTNMTRFLEQSPSVTTCDISGLKETIDFSGCPKLDYASINSILNSVSTVTGKSINLTGCEGYLGLTTDHPSVISAINKGWALIPEVTLNNLLDGANPPLSVSNKWISKRACGNITVEEDAFLLKTNGTCDWNKWYYALPIGVKKFNLICDVSVNSASTSTDASLYVSLTEDYNEYNKVYQTTINSGYVHVDLTISSSTNHIGFLARSTPYTDGDILAFNVKNLIVTGLN